jgi:hypothetical protein
MRHSSGGNRSVARPRDIHRNVLLHAIHPADRGVTTPFASNSARHSQICAASARLIAPRRRSRPLKQGIEAAICQIPGLALTEKRGMLKTGAATLMNLQKKSLDYPWKGSPGIFRPPP